MIDLRTHRQHLRKVKRGIAINAVAVGFIGQHLGKAILAELHSTAQRWHGSKRTASSKHFVVTARYQPYTAVRPN